ncbi:hypothetical protein [Bifidobacterium porcinum]|uniref:VG15 protein n=1 Tax=Bifidobacterium porcinum TaxID=212365 RepID=UPI003994E951
MTDWSNLSLTAKSRKTLETVLDASRTDYQQTMQGVSDYVDTLIGDLFDFDHPDKSLALTDPDAIVDAARNLVEIAQTAADNRYGVQRQAWQQAAGQEFPEYALPDREDWTRVMWDVQKGFSNTDYNGLTYRQVMAGKARSGVTIMDLLPKTAGMSIDDMQQAYADFFRSLAAHAGQRRQMTDIAGDPTRPRWARVPRGRVTCAFCTMLAGRGFVYTSEEAAGGGLGNRYHNHCDCEPVPTWGEAKLTGYDPDKLDALYRRAREGLPDGASYRDVLSRMRANGGVTDSPAAPGGGDGKPPKPHKAPAAASPEPDEPSRRDGRMWRPGPEGEQERRDSCRRTLDAGGLLSHDEYLSERRRLGFDMDFDEWVDSQIQAEIATRTPEWISRGIIGIPEADEDAAPSEDELRTAEKLEAWGVHCRFHKDWYEVVMPDGTKQRRGLADLDNGIELKEFKHKGGKYTVEHDLANAGNKKDCTCVVFDNTRELDEKTGEKAGYSDSELIEAIRVCKHAHPAAVYFLGKDGSFVKARNPIE